jgi:hypothetical protein
MIATEKLGESGFKYSGYTRGWVHQDFQHITFDLIDGVINHVRENDNYAGLSVNITTIRELLNFLKFLPQ